MKTKIEWCDYTINPVKGLCPMACDYCYARRMYKRFKWPERLEFQYAHFRHEIGRIKKPSRIFVGSTMELFGEWINSAWMRDIFEAISHYPQHTFIFLTKKPQNLHARSPFPDNCWVGASCIGDLAFIRAADHLSMVEAKVKFISFEPLRGWDFSATMDANDQNLSIEYILKDAGINWVIIGQQTPVKATTTPKIEWIREIVEAADLACAPVFLKENLSKLLKPVPGGLFIAKDVMRADSWLRQEFPK